MAILFGSKQFNRPTPLNLSNVIQVYTVIAAVILAWIGTSAAAFIPLKDSGIIQSILGLTIGIANGIKPFFGVSTTATSVPITQVGEMEEPKK
jgi:hypothetical protein